NLGAIGEAGAITTDDERLARHCQMLRDHGQSRKYYHDIEGYNGRLDAIQAGVLQVKLRYLAMWNEQRRERACGYDELFAGADGALALPYEPAWSRPVYHLYVVRVADRDRLQKDLAAAGIGTGIHYPIPLHLVTPCKSSSLGCDRCNCRSAGFVIWSWWQWQIRHRLRPHFITRARPGSDGHENFAFTQKCASSLTAHCGDAQFDQSCRSSVQLL